MLDRSRNDGAAVATSRNHDAFNPKLSVLVDWCLPAVLAEDLARPHTLDTGPRSVTDALWVLKQLPGDKNCASIESNAQVALMSALYVGS